MCRCQELQNIGRMKRRKKRVSATNVQIPDAAIEAAKIGTKVLAGFMTAEFVANTVGKAVSQANSKNGRALVKGGGAVLTAWYSFSKGGRKYQADLLQVAGGMAMNVVATLVKNSLPGNLQAIVPSVAGVRATPYLPQVTNSAVTASANIPD